MLCPSCETEVADDAAVCPNCDAVLDPSLFDASPPDEHAPPPPRRPPSKPARPAVKRPGGKPGVAAKKKPGAKSAPRPRADTPPPAKAPASDWRSQLSEEDWKENAVAAKPAFEINRSMDPDDWMAQTKLYLFELALADKLALGGTAVMLMASFFPWKETVADGDVLGVFSAGIIVAVLSAVALAGIIVRTKKSLPSLNPLLPWIAQLGCVGIAAIGCLVYMKQAWDPTLVQSQIGNYEVWASKPSLGLFISLIAGMVSLLGTIFGLKEVGK